MTAFSEVRKLVLESAGADRAISDFRLVLQAGGTVDEIGPGRLSAHDAHAIYEIRQRTARTAGVPIGEATTFWPRCIGCPGTGNSTVPFWNK